MRSINEKCDMMLARRAGRTGPTNMAGTGFFPLNQPANELIGHFQM